MRIILSLLWAFAIIANLGVCQTEDKFPVEVSATDEDMVGQRLVYLVKEGIRKSSSMRLSDDEEVRMVLVLITLDSDKRNTGNATTYSATWCWNNPEQPYPFYLTSTAGYCGASRVEESAQSLVASTDEKLSRMLKLLKTIRQ